MRKPSDQRAVKWLLVWCSAVAVMTTAAQPAPGQTWEAPSTVVTASDEAMINMAFNNTTVCGRGNDGTVHVVFTISSWLSAFEIATFPETATSVLRQYTRATGGSYDPAGAVLMWHEAMILHGLNRALRRLFPDRPEREDVCAIFLSVM